ncbi:MAG: glycosyltransferase family 8 protein [Microcoleus sp.]
MHLFIAGGQHYILGLAALLKSIELNASKNLHHSVKITLVSQGINLQQKERLQNCCHYQIDWQEFHSNYEELLCINGSKIAYVKLEPEKYTTESERLIWLDSDTIVLGSLESLWNLDLQGMPIAATPNAWGNPNNPRDCRPYFNTGLLVYDMKLWQQEQLSKKMMQSAKINLWGDCDQGAFNSVLAGRWQKLDPIWNNPDTEDMSTKVMHFMSRPKPWESLTPNKLWVEMLSQTPFYDDLHKIKHKSHWLVNFEQQYRQRELWVKQPIVKLKSYVKNKQR